MDIIFMIKVDGSYGEGGDSGGWGDGDGDSEK